MSRSKRLAKEGKVEVFSLRTPVIATVIGGCEEKDDVRYLGTDFDCLYDGRRVSADVYVDCDGVLYAVIEFVYEKGALI